MLIKSITVIIWMFILSLWIIPLEEVKALKQIWPDSWIGTIFTISDEAILNPPKDEENAMMKWTHTAVESEGNHKIWNISNTAEYYTTQEEAEEGTIKYVQRLINWALGMLAFVALIVVLYGWFQMVTASGDDAKFKSWKKALKKVSIGIIGIGISWLIISFFFWFVKLIA